MALKTCCSAIVKRFNSSGHRRKDTQSHGIDLWSFWCIINDQLTFSSHVNYACEKTARERLDRLESLRVFEALVTQTLIFISQLALFRKCLHDMVYSFINVIWNEYLQISRTSTSNKVLYDKA